MFLLVLVWVLWKHGHPFQRLSSVIHNHAWTLGTLIFGIVCAGPYSTVRLEVKNGFLEDELSLRNEHLLTSINGEKVS